MRLKFLCWFGFHVPFVEYPPETIEIENTVIGPVRRYCYVCGKTLPGEEPRVGDRMLR